MRYTNRNPTKYLIICTTSVSRRAVWQWAPRSMYEWCARTSARPPSTYLLHRSFACQLRAVGGFPLNRSALARLFRCFYFLSGVLLWYVQIILCGPRLPQVVASCGFLFAVYYPDTLKVNISCWCHYGK